MRQTGTRDTQSTDSGLRLLGRLSLALSACAFALPAAAVEMHSAGEVLAVEFTTTPPFICTNGQVCVPDVLRFSTGEVQVIETLGSRTARLYADGVLLGIYSRSAGGPTPGFVNPGFSGLFKDEASPFIPLDPTPVDLAPIVEGTTNGRIELALGSGRQDYMDGFPGVSITFRVATGPTSALGVSTEAVITSVQVVPDTALQAVVDSTAADPDALPGDGVCATTFGECTLPAAVEEANAFPGTNHVSIPAGSHPGGLAVSESITIEGAGAGVTTVDAGGSGSVFTLTAGRATLQSLSLTGGSSGGDGGGIALQGGGLLLFDVEIHGNSAAGDGGGLHQAAGTDALIIDGSIHPNTAGGSGGGIFATGLEDLSVDGTRIHDNTATTGDGGGIHSSTDFLLLDGVQVHDNSAQRGGGVMSSDFFAFVVESRIHGNMATGWAAGATFSGVDVLIEASTFDGNQSTGGAGALRLAGGVFAELLNVTLSGNTGLAGGGLLIESPSEAGLTNVTVALNQATTGGGLLLSSLAGFGNLELGNTLVAGNGAATGPDCTSAGGGVALGSLGHNLVGDGSDCAFPATTGDQVGSGASPIDPLLAPLAAPFPGPPPVHDLLPGSPAIDLGSPETPDSSPSSCLGFDQLFRLRPFDGDGDGDARCDIGAVETGSMAVPALGPGGLAALALGLAAAGAGLARTRFARGRG